MSRLRAGTNATASGAPLYSRQASRNIGWRPISAALAISVIVQPSSAAQAQPFAFVANSGSDNVSVVDTSTRAVTRTIPIGMFPYGVAVSPSGALVYVASGAEFGVVSVIDTTTGTIASTIAVGSGPFGIAITPDGALVYAANAGFPGSVSVIGTATNTVIATIPARMPFGVAIAPDGAFAYVTDSLLGVLAIRTATNAVTNEIFTGDEPKLIATTPNGAHVYVTNASCHDNFTSGSISVIDTADYSISATIELPDTGGPGGIAITPNGAFAYVADSTFKGRERVLVIDTATNTVVTEVPVGVEPRGIATTPDGAFVYVTNDFADNVSIIDTKTNTVMTTIPVGHFPVGIAIGPAPTSTPSPSPSPTATSTPTALVPTATRSPAATNTPAPTTTPSITPSMVATAGNAGDGCSIAPISEPGWSLLCALSPLFLVIASRVLSTRGR